MQPNGPSPVLPHLSYKPINQAFEKETIGARPPMVQRPITSDFSAINGEHVKLVAGSTNIQELDLQTYFWTTFWTKLGAFSTLTT